MTTLRQVLCTAICFHFLSLTSFSRTPVQLTEDKIDSAHYYLSKLDRPDLALAMCMEALLYDQELKDAGEDDLRRLLRLRHIDVFTHIHDIERAIPILEEFLVMEKTAHPESSAQYYFNLGKLAIFYLNNGQKIKADSAVLESIRIANKLGDPVLIAGSTNNYGIFQERDGQLEDAWTVYKQALGVMRIESYCDTGLYISILDNMASILEKRNQHTAANVLLDSILILAPSSKNPNYRATITNIELAQNYLVLGDPEMARFHLEKIVDTLGFRNKTDLIDIKLEIERTWVELAETTKDDALAIEHLHAENKLSQIKFQNALRTSRKIEQNIAAVSIQSFNRNLIVKEEQLRYAQLEVRSNRTIILILVSLGLLLIVGIILFFSKRLTLEKVQKQLKEAQLKIEQQDNDRLKRNLGHKENDFSNVMMQLALKEDWANELIGKLTELIKENKAIHPDVIRRFAIDLKQKANVHRKIELIQDGMADTNSRFFGELEELYPKLTKVELEMCGLIRLNLDGKEIASIRNINPGSVKKMRQRLRKKLGIDAKQDLYAFIQSI